MNFRLIKQIIIFRKAVTLLINKRNNKNNKRNFKILKNAKILVNILMKRKVKNHLATMINNQIVTKNKS